MLRQKDLCPGPADCPQVLMEQPDAGADALPCEGCPAEELRLYVTSPAGALVRSVIDLDFMLQAGIHIPWTDISYPEVLLLRQLAEERDAHQLEQMKRHQGHGG